jgi:hypothetical protein
VRARQTRAKRQGKGRYGTEGRRTQGKRPAEAPIIRGAAWIKDEDATRLLVGAERQLAHQRVRIRVWALDTDAFAAGRRSPLLHQPTRPRVSAGAAVSLGAACALAYTIAY